MTAHTNILVAIDLSQASDTVMKKASKYAKLTHGVIHVVHVIEGSPAIYSGEFAIPINVDVQQQIASSTHDAILKLGKKHHIQEDRLFTTEGSVKLEIARIAKDMKADLIIVGTHGHHGLEVFMGSRANAIIHAAPCDVLAVRTD